MSIVSTDTLVRHSSQPLQATFKSGPGGMLGLGRLHTLHVRKVLEIHGTCLPAVLSVFKSRVSDPIPAVTVVFRFCNDAGRMEFLRIVAEDVDSAHICQWDN